MPVNALVDDTDPTREIRTLIEQLNNTARDARTQVEAAQKEKDSVAAELQQALAQLRAAQAREADVQSQAMQTAAAISERDAALAAGERYVQTIGEMQKRLDATARELQDSTRQRQEAVRSASDGNVQLHEFQQQVTSLRQARDAAQTRVRAVEEKLARAEDKIAELEYAQEGAQKETRHALEELASFRRQFEAATLDRDATARQVEELLTEIDAQRKKALDLAEEKAQATEADEEQMAALLEARQQVASISFERDAARARMLEQAREIDELREQLEVLRESQAAAQATIRELSEISAQVDAVAAERDAHRLALDQALAEGSAQQQQFDALAEQLATSQRGRQEAVDALTAAEKQVEYILHDRELILSQSTEAGLAHERQLADVRSRIAELEKSLDETRRRVMEFEAMQEKLRIVTQRFEQQRLESIELATRFDAAKREIIELTANLAETRLQMRSAAGGKPKSMQPGEATQPASRTREADQPSAGKLPVHAANGRLTENSSRTAIAVMRKCYQDFTKQPADRSPLAELCTQIQSFGEQARTSGLVAIHRLSAGFAEFTHGLYRLPDQVDTSSWRTVHQTIEFLAAAVKDTQVAHLEDPANMNVYAVDDDPDNCRAISKAMDTVMVQTTTAQDPSVALAALAEARFDLIFLDVNLPGMDGFALCSEIRRLPLHATTPIIFLTGMNTVEKRAQSSLCGGNEFVGKPFNLHELSVKALTLILKSQLSGEHRR